MSRQDIAAGHERFWRRALNRLGDWVRRASKDPRQPIGRAEYLHHCMSSAWPEQGRSPWAAEGTVMHSHAFVTEVLASHYFAGNRDGGLATLRVEGTQFRVRTSSMLAEALTEICLTHRLAGARRVAVGDFVSVSGWIGSDRMVIATAVEWPAPDGTEQPDQ
jgi:hypothetical protein